MATSEGQRDVKPRLAVRVRRAVISVTAVNGCRSENDPRSTFRQMCASTRPVPLLIAPLDTVPVEVKTGRYVERERAERKCSA